MRALQDRLRAGALSQEQVGIAAYCGDPAARIVAGRDDGVEQECCMDYGAGCKLRVAGDHAAADAYCAYRINDWALGLPRRPEVQVRAALAAELVVLPWWEGRGPIAWSAASQGMSPEAGRVSCVSCYGGSHEDCGDPCCCEAPRLAAEATNAWLDCPCPQHGVEAFAAGERTPAFFHAARAAGLYQAQGFDERARELCQMGIREAARLTRVEAPVRAAICKSLIDWALGRYSVP